LAHIIILCIYKIAKQSFYEMDFQWSLILTIESNPIIFQILKVQFISVDLNLFD